MIAAATNILEWVLGKLPVLIFVLIFVAQLVRGLFRNRRATPPAPIPPDELEAQRRVKEIQDQIRRRIAERRGGRPSGEVPPMTQNEPPSRPVIRRIETTRMPEPFGGPLRRVFEEIQREMQPPSTPTGPSQLPPVIEERNAELERQEQLAEKMRVLEESRMLMKRRATQLAAATNTLAQSETGLRSLARGQLLEDLRDPVRLRRAFVLREVLGPPVALR